MDIDNLATVIENTYYSPTFIKLIEDHLTYLRTTNNVTVINLTNVQCVKFQGDFYGLLVDLKIEKTYHYAILRVNNYLSASDFDGSVAQIVVPDTTVIDRLKNTLQTGPNF